MNWKHLVGASVLWVLASGLWQVIRVLFDQSVDIDTLAASLWFGLNGIIFAYVHTKIHS